MRAGQHEYSAFQENAIRTADVQMLVFRVEDPRSFEEAKLIFQLSRRLRPRPSPTVLVANKMDRRYNRPEAIDQITAKAATWAQEHEIPFIHTSARTPMNVCEAFQLALSLSHQTQSSNRPVSIGLLGSGGVGKSSLRLRYTMGVFVNNYDPTIEEVDSKLVQRLASTGDMGEVGPGGAAAVVQDDSRPAPLDAGDKFRRIPNGRNPEIDTNVISLDLDSLGDEIFFMLDIERLSMAPSNCECCGAVIEASQICRFCDRNALSADEESHRKTGGQNVIEYDLVSVEDRAVAPSGPDDGVTLFASTFQAP